MSENTQTVKVSGAGWLCVETSTFDWIPVIKLTRKQIDEWVEMTSGKRTEGVV